MLFSSRNLWKRAHGEVKEQVKESRERRKDVFIFTRRLAVKSYHMITAGLFQIYLGIACESVMNQTPPVILPSFINSELNCKMLILHF